MDNRTAYEIYLDEFYGKGRASRTDEVALDLSKQQSIYDMSIEDAVAMMTDYSCTW
jgi:hypothetical protein